MLVLELGSGRELESALVSSLVWAGAECEHTRTTRSSQLALKVGSSRIRILAPGTSTRTLAVFDAGQRILNEASAGLLVAEAAAGS